MNPLETVLSQIDAIDAAKGKEKASILQAYDSPLMRKVFLYALDPYRMYGVTKFDDMKAQPLEFNSYYSEVEFFRTLDALVARSVTGNAAKQECEFLCAKFCAPPELLRRILNKDLRCGVAATTVNKVFKDLIPTFKVALAKEYEEDDEDQFPKLESTKYDGLRCIALCKSEEDIKFYTRNGLEITSAEHVKPMLAKYLPPFEMVGMPVMLDGELMKTTGHFQDSSGSIRSKSKQDTSLIYRIFDWMPLQEFLDRECSRDQKTRAALLEDWDDVILNTAKEPLPFVVVYHTEVRSNSEVQERYKAARAAGQEGLILKDPKAKYQFKRSTAWVKLKDLKTYEGKVLGMEPGKGKYEGMMGALVVDFEGKPNRMGTGFSDDQRRRFMKNPELILGKMVEGAYHEETKDGNMRHSRFIKERPDLE